MPINKTYLAGVLYLHNADQILTKKIVVDGKLVVIGEDGSYILARLINTHDVILEGYQAVRALAFTRANGDSPIEVIFEGELLSRNGISIPRANKIKFLVPDKVSRKAKEIIVRLQKNDTFLAASFENTVQQHQQKLSIMHKVGATAD